MDSYLLHKWQSTKVPLLNVPISSMHEGIGGRGDDADGDSDSDGYRRSIGTPRK